MLKANEDFVKYIGKTIVSVTTANLDGVDADSVTFDFNDGTAVTIRLNSGYENGYWWNRLYIRHHEAK
jgi:hypothetical protein